MNECRYFDAKGYHVYVPYMVIVSGETGECCHGCGKELKEANDDR